MLFAGAAVDAQTILISDLSGVEAVRILFAGAAEDTQTIISDLSGVEARRHTLFQVAQWTPRPMNLRPEEGR